MSLRDSRGDSSCLLSNSLEGEMIGLEEVGDVMWSIVYYDTILGRTDLRTGGITGNDHV